MVRVRPRTYMQGGFRLHILRHSPWRPPDGVWVRVRVAVPPLRMWIPCNGGHGFMGMLTANIVVALAGKVQVRYT